MYIYFIYCILLMDIENRNGNVCNKLDSLSFISPEWLAEIRKNQESLRNLADDVLSNALWCEKSDLKNNVLLACLREQVSLYEKYANSVKQNPNLKKYFQKYNFKGKDFLVIPSIDKDTKKIHLETYEIYQKNGKYSIYSWFSRNSQESIADDSRSPDLLAINFPNESVKDKFSTLYMNKWTWKIKDVNPYDYKMDNEWIKWLMSTIEENWNSKLADCSENLQSSVSDILWKENELDEQGRWFEQQKIKIAQSIMKWDLAWAVGGFIEIVKLFFTRKKAWRVVWLGKGINYEWDERDVKYLESAISTVLEPEKRSELTYLISKIKDKHIKDSMKEKWVNNPSQFDLLLQNCEPGQIMLTNALDLEWWSSAFKFATQVASWSRWCHALIISDVIKDSNWIITDAKIIQSTLKWWVHETTLKKYISENYSSSDFLLANISEDKREKLVDSARKNIGQKYDRVSIVTDWILWADVDSLINADGIKWNLLWKNKAYCSELVFDAMKTAWLWLPEPHMSPSDLLLTEDISPQYACYCDRF